MDIINTILSSSRTVFTTQWLAMMDSTRTRESLNNSLRYYARTGVLRSPRNGIYTKQTYNEQEMACALLISFYGSYMQPHVHSPAMRLLRKKICMSFNILFVLFG